MHQTLATRRVFWTPAIGDGSLMEALVLRLDTPHVTGCSTPDSKAVTAALSRLERFVSLERLDVQETDFTALCLQVSARISFRSNPLANSIW